MCLKDTCWQSVFTELADFFLCNVNYTVFCIVTKKLTMSVWYVREWLVLWRQQLGWRGWLFHSIHTECWQLSIRRFSELLKRCQKIIHTGKPHRLLRVSFADFYSSKTCWFLTATEKQQTVCGYICLYSKYYFVINISVIGHIILSNLPCFLHCGV